MIKTWPSWRTWRRVGIGVLLTLILVVLALRLFAMSPMARNMVEARLEAMSIRGQSFEIDGLRGDLLGRASIESLRVRDESGVWLTATDVDLGWRPLALVSRHLNIRTVSATTLDIERRPALTPSQASSGSVADRYTLADLQLGQLLLADGVAGPAQSYAVTGALQATSAQGNVQLDLSTLTANGDSVRADLAWGGTVPLAGDVRLSAAPNGLVATLLGAPKDAPLTFDLTSSSVQNKWQLAASGTVDGVPALDVEIDLSDTQNAAKGEIALNQLRLLAPLHARLGETLVFDGYVGAENRLQATARSDSFDAVLSGTLQSSLNGVVIENLDLTVRAMDAGKLTSLQSLSLPQFTARGMLYLRNDMRAFDGVLDAPYLTYGSYQLQTVQSDGRINYLDGSVSYDGQFAAGQVSGLPAALQEIFAGASTLNLNAVYGFSARRIQARSFDLQNPSFDLTGTGSAIVGGPVILNADIKTESIYDVAESRTKLALNGPKLSELTLTVAGDASLSDSAGAIRNLIGDQANFSLTARRTPSGIALQSGRIHNERIDATASGALSGNTVDLSGRATMSSLSLASIFASRLDTEFELSGPMSSPRLTTNAAAEELTLAGQTFSRPDLSAEITLADDTPFIVSAQTLYSGEMLSLNLQGIRRGDLVDLTQLLITWADLQASGNASVNTGAPRDATLRFEVAGTSPIGGTVDGTLSYEATQLRSDVSLVGLKMGALDIDETKLELSGTWPRFEGGLEYQAEFPLLGTPQAISGIHPVRVDASSQTLTLSGRSEMAGNPILITTPVTLSMIPNLRLAGGMSAFGGDISVIFDASGASPAVFALSGLKMSEIGPLLERPSLVGTLDGAFTLGLEDGELMGGGSASILNLARGVVDSAETNLALQVEIATNQLSAELRTDEADMGLDLMANLTAPLIHANSLGSVRIAPDAAIPVAVKGRGAFGPIWALIAPTNLRLAGDVDLDISNGSGTSWRFEGPFSLQNAEFEDGYTGIHLKDIAADAQLRPDGIDVDQVSARGASGGQVTGRGLYGFDGNGSVTMTLNRLNALKRSDVSGSLSGTAEIERRNRRTQISGDLEIDEARINLERLPGAGYTTLEVDFQQNGENEEPSAPTREAIELRLDVSADRRIFVSGSGVDTEWGLDARVTGPPGRPNVIGRATLIRGEADLLSRRFRFSEGAIRFVGTPIDSLISLRADRTNDDITSSISLSGTLMDPEITLSSSPSLPDDEILSRVLFGRSPSELSPLQAAQLAGAAAQLAGGDAFNLVGQLQAATGLDRLDIGLDDSGGATLSTGKYLADDIYLEIESGVTGAPGVTLEWTPLENVAVDAEIDPELGPKLAIQWKRDFDRLPGEPKED